MVVFLENFAVEQALLGKRHTVGGVVCPAELEFLVGVEALGVLLDVVHHAVAHSVGEGGLFAPQDLRRQPVALERLAQQVFALAVAVQLLFGVDGHDVPHKVQITERHAGLDAVGGDAAVGAQDVVHIQLADALLAFLLECVCGGGVVGVLVAKQLVGDLAGQQHADVGLLVDGLAQQVHPHAGPDGGDVPGTQQTDDLFEAADDHIPVDDDLVMLAAQILGGLAGIFQVDGVGVHADGKGADGLAHLLGGDGADQRGVETARQQEAHGCVGVQTLLHACNELFADVGQDGVHLVLHGGGNVGDVLVADKASVAVVAADGEGADVIAPADEVLHLRGKCNLVAGLGVAVEQRTDADGVAGCDEAVLAGIVQDERKFGVHVAEHIEAVLIVERQQDLAVAVGGELVAPALQNLFLEAEAVELAVADHAVGPAVEGLHPLRRQAHDGEASEAHQAERPFHHTLVVRPARDGAHQVFFELVGTHIMPGIAYHTAHISYPSCVGPLRCIREAFPSSLLGERQIKKYGSKHPFC